MKFFDLELDGFAGDRTVIWSKPNISANGMNCNNQNTRWLESNTDPEKCKANHIVWTKPNNTNTNCKNVYQF